MALPRILLQLACFASLATNCVSFKECFACGCAKCEVGYPRGVISIPSDLQDSLGNLETITCFQFNQAGMGGLLPENICELNRLASSRAACDCPGGGGIIVEEEEVTNAPTAIAFDELKEPTGAPSQVESPRRPVSDSPSAVPHAITAHAPVAPVMAPVVPESSSSWSSTSHKKTSTKVVGSSASKMSNKKDQSMPSKSSSEKSNQVHGKGASTESELKSKQPKGTSSTNVKKEEKPKKERTEKKVSTKLVK